jgi:hypothetical protein
MTQQEFVNQISIVYRDARNLLVDKGDHDILRGTAHSVSGYMEDAFAVYMATRINKKAFQYIVDKLVCFQQAEKNKTLTFKPDLAIIDSGLLTHYYDLKTNLGWSGDFKKFLIAKNELIEKIRGNEGWITFPHIDEQNPKIKQLIRFAENLKYKVVVYDGWNINQDQLNNYLKLATTLKNVEMCVLKESVKGEKYPIVNQEAFDSLY